MKIELSQQEMNTLRVALAEMTTTNKWKRSFSQPVRQMLEETANSLLDKFNKQIKKYK